MTDYRAEYKKERAQATEAQEERKGRRIRVATEEQGVLASALDEATKRLHAIASRGASKFKDFEVGDRVSLTYKDRVRNGTITVVYAGWCFGVRIIASKQVPRTAHVRHSGLELLGGETQTTEQPQCVEAEKVGSEGNHDPREKRKERKVLAALRREGLLAAQLGEAVAEVQTLIDTDASKFTDFEVGDIVRLVYEGSPRTGEVTGVAIDAKGAYAAVLSQGAHGSRILHAHYGEMELVG